MSENKNVLLMVLIFLGILYLLGNYQLFSTYFGGLYSAPIQEVTNTKIVMNGIITDWVDTQTPFSRGLCIIYDNVKIPEKYGSLYGFGDCNSLNCYLVSTTPLDSYYGYFQIMDSEVLPLKSFDISSIRVIDKGSGPFNQLEVCGDIHYEDFISTKPIRDQSKATKINIYLEIYPSGYVTTTTTTSTTTTTIKPPIECGFTEIYNPETNKCEEIGFINKILLIIYEFLGKIFGW
ncbi:MAG: hypothetical protein DRG27_04525 [Deltaproteobacteria bacterium]|nr:MAG: hypothetical protein DRG27_04525 [Deltaproteobacteria bacterium]